MLSRKEATICVVVFAIQLVGVTTKLADVPYGGPPLPPRPFVAVWNAPYKKCRAGFGVDLNLSSYNIVANPDGQWYGTYSAIFNHDQLGLYPYYNNSIVINGGIPQVVNMTAHLAKAAEDIAKRVPDPDFRGLGVLDWEKWKPLWHRNWDSQAIYKKASRDLVEKRHPDWPKKKIEAVAKAEFEIAARTMFAETLLLARTLRPKGIWGFYRFPACYNHKNRTTTGWDCPEIEKERNDQLQWLFEDSTVIYPSIYLHNRLASSDVTRRVVYFRMKEAFRKRASREGRYTPVYAYTRFMYVVNREFLTKEDLINTMGQAANMGADGIVIWGDHHDTNTKEDCLKLQSYLQTTLGPCILNITTDAAKCSERHCSGQGRCVLATGNLGNRPSVNNGHVPKVIKSNEIVETVTNHVNISFVNTTGKDHLEKTANHVINHVMSTGSDWMVANDDVFPTCACYPGWSGKTCHDKISL